MYDKNGFEGKVAVISGGAGGIGMAVCRLLKEKGCKIAMFDISDAAMDAAGKELGMDEDSLLRFNVNIGDKAEVQNAVRAAAEKFGQINFLINNAGGSTASKLIRGSDGKPEPTPMLENESEEVWDTMMDVNFKGYYLCSQAVAPYMKKTGGSIVSLCSKVARSGRKTGGAGYVSAKAGVIGLTRQLAVELGPYNINANAVAPGLVNTDRALKNWNAPGRETPESRKEILDSIPLRRTPGDDSREAIGAWPEDIANVIMFLCSNEGSYITGVTLDVNGGWYFS